MSVLAQTPSTYCWTVRIVASVMLDFKLCIVVFMQPLLGKVFIQEIKCFLQQSRHMAVYFQMYNIFVEIMLVFVETELKLSTASLLW